MFDIHDSNDDHHAPERRRRGWTLWREIYGTVIGTLPFVLALFAWGSSITERLRVVEIEVEHSKIMRATDVANARDDRQDIARKLDRITMQIEELQKLVAHDGGRLGR